MAATPLLCVGSTWEPCPNSGSDLVGPGRGPRPCVFNQLPGQATPCTAEGRSPRGGAMGTARITMGVVVTCLPSSQVTAVRTESGYRSSYVNTTLTKQT